MLRGESPASAMTLGARVQSKQKAWHDSASQGRGSLMWRLYHSAAFGAQTRPMFVWSQLVLAVHASLFVPPMHPLAKADLPGLSCLGCWQAKESQPLAWCAGSTIRTWKRAWTEPTRTTSKGMASGRRCWSRSVPGCRKLPGGWTGLPWRKMRKLSGQLPPLPYRHLFTRYYLRR